jgi:hypothetical protein
MGHVLAPGAFVADYSKKVDGWNEEQNENKKDGGGLLVVTEEMSGLTVDLSLTRFVDDICKLFVAKGEGNTRGSN